MADQTITVIAHIRAKQGFEQAMKDSLSALVAPTLQEQGCINYDLHQDLRDPTLFIFHENWQTEEALDRHLESDHLKDWAADFVDWLAEPVEIYRLTKIS